MPERCRPFEFATLVNEFFLEVWQKIFPKCMVPGIRPRQWEVNLDLRAVQQHTS
jgi:hypothetical protein